eukprot:scaffold6125_cov262-Ochromonas_danica.AAC.7
MQQCNLKQKLILQCNAILLQWEDDKEMRGEQELQSIRKKPFQLLMKRRNHQIFWMTFPQLKKMVPHFSKKLHSSIFYYVPLTRIFPEIITSMYITKSYISFLESERPLHIFILEEFNKLFFTNAMQTMYNRGGILAMGVTPPSPAARQLLDNTVVLVAWVSSLISEKRVKHLNLWPWCYQLFQVHEMGSFPELVLNVSGEYSTNNGLQEL